MLEICTIGFGQKSLKSFIQLLKEAGVTKVIDVRLNNTSQLSGFAKKDDLQFILELVGIDYEHDISVAPDKLLLDDYKKKAIDWSNYEKRYVDSLIKKGISNCSIVFEMARFVFCAANISRITVIDVFWLNLSTNTIKMR